MRLGQRAYERFMQRVRTSDGCWEWQGGRTTKGYGQFSDGKRKKHAAHRVAWFFHRGEIPEDLHVLHRCDNPGCVNPEHLFLGTNADNVADKVSKGRCARMAREMNPMWRNFKCAARGERTGGARFTEAEVMTIRQDWASGMSQVALAKRHATAQAHIYGIVHGLTWTHLPTISRPPGVGPRHYVRPSREIVASIRRDWELGLTNSDLVRKYGYGSVTIRKIVRGETHAPCASPLVRRQDQPFTSVGVSGSSPASGDTDARQLTNQP